MATRRPLVVLDSGARGELPSGDVSVDVAAHEAAADPHPPYVKKQGGELSGYAEALVTASVTGTYSVDLDSANEYLLTLTGDCTISVTGTATAGFVRSATIRVDPATFVVSWNAGIDWGTAGAPTLEASKLNYVVVDMLPDGVVRAMAGGKGFAP